MTEAAWRRGRWMLAVLGLLSLIACGAGYASEPRQFYASYLVAFTYFLTLALGSAFFLMAWRLSGAAWSAPVRGLMEDAMATLPLMPVLFLPVVAGLPTLYEWARPEFQSQDPVLQVKMVFFNPTFFLARAAVYFAVWGVLAATHRRRPAWSGPGLVLLTITVTMAAVDWLMSLEPHWYSTIFGIYIFSGGGLAFLAALIVISLALRRGGLLKDSIHVEHYHDLGRWLFTVVVFWAYIAFSQYLLIWYANLPEETVWFRHRLEGNWTWVSASLLVGDFILPFLLLIGRGAKRNLRLLGSVSALLLVMHYIDLHWVVMPTVHHHGFHLHWLDLAAFALVGSACGLVFWSRLRRTTQIPQGDLRLGQALRHQTE